MNDGNGEDTGIIKGIEFFVGSVSVAEFYVLPDLIIPFNHRLIYCSIGRNGWKYWHVMAHQGYEPYKRGAMWDEYVLIGEEFVQCLEFCLNNDDFIESEELEELHRLSKAGMLNEDYFHETIKAK